jgi:hypothetical protein
MVPSDPILDVTPEFAWRDLGKLPQAYITTAVLA